MGSGIRGDFGKTHGSKKITIASSKQENSLKLVSKATEKEKNIINKSPIKIPNSATYETQSKKGYDQIKIKFSRGSYYYESRWHTETPNSPTGTGNTYQVTRKVKGKGYGADASKKKIDHMIKYPSGKIKWISDSVYQDAIRNNKKGIATKKEKEMIKYGHIK